MSKNRILSRKFQMILVCMLFSAVGCRTWNLPAKYELSEQLSMLLAEGKRFELDIHNGSITVAGTDTSECRVAARILVRAKTDEEAKIIAEEEVKVQLVPIGDTLAVEITKPAHNSRRYSLYIDFDVKVPRQTNLEIKSYNGKLLFSHIVGYVEGTTHNGSVAVEDINGDVRLATYNGGVKLQAVQGDINAKTHNGYIRAVDVSGDLELKTYNQKVTAREIEGNINAESHNGGITVSYKKNAPAVREVRLKTHNGGIKFTGPENFSSAVEAKTYNGSIEFKRPVLFYGKVSRHLTGTIGDGKGKLYLETHNGSIRIN